MNVPDFGPPEAPVQVDEDDPEDDLDPPLQDAFSASEEEVWSEGPVDLQEDEDSLPGDPIGVEAPEVLGSIDFSLLPCVRCHRPAETARCETCLEELCRECAGEAAADAWEEQRAFVCVECAPASEGKFVRPTR